MLPYLRLLPFVLILLLAGCDPAAESSRPPNIIYMLADDAGWADFGVYGQQLFDTPNVDRIAAEGMQFLQHYAGSTVCAPSRSVLMTGLHTGHTYIRGNKEVRPEGQEPLADSIYTMAEMFQDAGYATGAFGKWGLGFPGSEGDPLNQGFDRFYGYNCQRLAHHYYPYYLWDNDQMVTLEGNEEDGMAIYAPDIIQEKTLEFIEAHQDEPFFLFVPFIIPHAELIAPEDEIFDEYRERLEDPVAYAGVDYGEERYRLGPYGSQPTPRAAFAAMMARMDRSVGEILDKLDELGLSENTIVMFTSDNGPGKEGGMDPDFFDGNGPYRGYKRDLYEGGIRVPMVVKWPGRVEAGSTTEHISAFWDVWPTVSEAAGLDVPQGIDGISFLPTLEGRSADQGQHEYLYWEFHERGGRQAVRMGDWKGVKYDIFSNPNANVELYDLSSDPGETLDLATANPEVVAEIEAILEEAHVDSDLFPALNGDD